MGGTIEEGGTILFSGPTPGALKESGALLDSGSQKENLRYVLRCISGTSPLFALERNYWILKDGTV